MFGIHGAEWWIILIIVLIIFGPAKLPDLAKAIGKSVNEFRKGIKGVEDDLKEKPGQPAASPSVPDEHEKLISLAGQGNEPQKSDTAEKR